MFLALATFYPNDRLVSPASLLDSQSQGEHLDLGVSSSLLHECSLDVHGIPCFSLMIKVSTLTNVLNVLL